MTANSGAKQTIDYIERSGNVALQTCIEVLVPIRRAECRVEEDFPGKPVHVCVQTVAEANEQQRRRKIEIRNGTCSFLRGDESCLSVLFAVITYQSPPIRWFLQHTLRTLVLWYISKRMKPT